MQFLKKINLNLVQTFDKKIVLGEELYQKILLDKLELNQGMLIENIVAQMFVASGHTLYFYSTNAPSAPDRMEIDFLIEKQTLTNAHNICPIEVKSGKRYTTTSLNKFKAKYQEQLHTPYVIHCQDLEQRDGVVFLPIYMTSLI